LKNLYPRFKKAQNFYPLYTDDGYWNPANAGLENYAKYQNNFSQFSNFSTYSDKSQISLLALTGNITQFNQSALLSKSDGVMVLNELVTGAGFGTLGLDRYYSTSPSQLQAVSLAGKLTTLNGLTLFPSTNAQLNLWAQDDIALNNGTAGSIRILDVQASSLSNPTAPRIFNTTDMRLLKESYATGANSHFSRDATEITVSSHIVSLKDVIGDSEYAQFSLNLPMVSSISAGRDIVNLGLAVQNNFSSDTSLLIAGRDIRDETINNKDCTEPSSQCISHLVTGPGRVYVSAGRDIDLGNQAGIVTRGNLDNPYLKEGGASIQLTTAGMKPDYASLIKYLQDLRVQGTDKTILEFETFQTTASLLTDKFNLPHATDTDKNKLFFQILYQASLLKDKSTNKISFTYFDNVIASLFPDLNRNTAIGNLSSHSSQIKTEQGGSIDIFAPTGSVYAGLAIGKTVSKPSNQGIFTVRGGDINALVSQDFLVNQGRVFTLAGGDIYLVSQYRNLEAGKGSKTASSAPPPLIVISTDGSITVDTSVSIAGSGIGALVTKPNQPESSIFAAAPRGYIDAGDAGFRVDKGSANFNTPQIRNADNISASGGVSSAQAPAVVAAPAPPPPPPPAASNTADDAKKTLAGGANPNNNLANLSVELLGFGDTSAGSSANSKDKDKDKDKDKEDKEKN